MKIKGIIKFQRKNDYIFSTHLGDFSFDFTELSREQVFNACTKTRFWECEIQNNKVTKIVKAFVPRKLREAKQGRATIAGIYGASMSYHMGKCYWCNNRINREEIAIDVADVYLHYKCALDVLGSDFPVKVPVADNEPWMGAAQPKLVIIKLKHAKLLKDRSGGLINYIKASELGEVKKNED